MVRFQDNVPVPIGDGDAKWRSPVESRSARQEPDPGESYKCLLPGESRLQLFSAFLQEGLNGFDTTCCFYELLTGFVGFLQVLSHGVLGLCWLIWTVRGKVSETSLSISGPVAKTYHISRRTRLLHQLTDMQKNDAYQT